MNNLTINVEQRVKSTFVHDGFFHIDLYDGMRLSGPLRNNAGGLPGASRLVETAPSADWKDCPTLDDLISD
jgi:hypothetical protein